MNEESIMKQLYEIKELYCELDKAHSEILFKQIKQEARIKKLENNRV